LSNVYTSWSLNNTSIVWCVYKLKYVSIRRDSSIECFNAKRTHNNELWQTVLVRYHGREKRFLFMMSLTSRRHHETSTCIHIRRCSCCLNFKLHTNLIDNIHSRKAWRYQRRNTKPWIVIGQTTQWPQDTKEMHNYPGSMIEHCTYCGSYGSSIKYFINKWNCMLQLGIWSMGSKINFKLINNSNMTSLTHSGFHELFRFWYV
jgi:hypothetical protein